LEKAVAIVAFSVIAVAAAARERQRVTADTFSRAEWISIQGFVEDGTLGTSVFARTRRSTGRTRSGRIATGFIPMPWRISRRGK
jgi:hypothetical protein